MAEARWTTRTPIPGQSLTREGLRVDCRTEPHAALVSGDLAAATRQLALGAPKLGLLEPVQERTFFLRIARDRALFCSESPIELEGWQDGYAISAADDLYLELVIQGPRTADLQAALIDADPGSPSAATLVLGIPVLACTLPEGLSLRVPHPDAAALWAHLADPMDRL